MSITISAKDVMKLRQKTGLGMMDCKEALEVNNGDFQQAEEWLRAKQKGKMDQRTERATGEGRIAFSIEGGRAAIVEVQCETDFTARNDEFVAMVNRVAALALNLPAGPIEPTDEIKAAIDDIRIKTGENMHFSRGEKLEGGAFGAYLHHDNKHAALIQASGPLDAELIRGICQHIVAHVPPPIAVDDSEVPADQIEKIRREAVAEAAASGKPEQIAQKMAEGRVRKFLEEITLLNQKYVRDDSKSIKELLPPSVTITRFVRMTLGQSEG